MCLVCVGTVALPSQHPIPPSRVTVPALSRRRADATRSPSLATEREGDTVGLLLFAHPPSPCSPLRPAPRLWAASPPPLAPGSCRIHRWDWSKVDNLSPQLGRVTWTDLVPKEGHSVCAAWPPSVSLSPGAPILFPPEGPSPRSAKSWLQLCPHCLLLCTHRGAPARRDFLSDLRPIQTASEAQLSLGHILCPSVGRWEQGLGVPAVRGLCRTVCCEVKSRSVDSNHSYAGGLRRGGPNGPLSSETWS